MFGEFVLSIIILTGNISLHPLVMDFSQCAWLRVSGGGEDTRVPYTSLYSGTCIIQHSVGSNVESDYKGCRIMEYLLNGPHKLVRLESMSGY